MNISDIRTRIESSEKSSLVTRIAELEETPVLTLVDTAERSETEISEMPDPLIQALDEMPDPLIQALVKKLPSPIAFGVSKIVLNGFGLRRSYSILCTSPASRILRRRTCHQS